MHDDDDDVTTVNDDHDAHNDDDHNYGETKMKILAVKATLPQAQP